MSGVEVARALRAKHIDTYVVGCTGNALREDQDEYLRAGADDIIPKPVSQTAIVKRLEEARRRREERERNADRQRGNERRGE
jgi:DNA-binding response OmpR family regulator